MNIEELISKVMFEDSKLPNTERLIAQFKEIGKHPLDLKMVALEYIIQSNDNWLVEHALNTGDKDIIASILSDETVTFFLDHGITPYLLGLPGYPFSAETINKVLYVNPDSIYHLPPELITYDMAITVVTGDAELFQSVPEQFQTLELAKKIYPNPSNYINLPLSIKVELFDLWLAGQFEFYEGIGNGKKRIFQPPKIASDVFELYRYSAREGMFSNFFKVMLEMTPYLLSRFDPAQCWSAAQRPEEKGFVIEAFGKERLIAKADIGNQHKRDWLEDGLGL